ncbi:MAG: hypothetical protein K8Q99_01880 [Acholeplasmataceae bacterium]|nr:hypothetical protein [Acholeplasmataceae bacterium]
MQIFLSIGPIVIDFSMLISFLIGVSFGFLLLLLIYLYAVLRSLNKGLKLRKADETDIDEEEIKWLIQDGQKLFKDKDIRNEVGYAKHLQNISAELAVDIAKKFYPNSKYPYLELTVDESLTLAHYITDRVEELLKGKILRMTKGLTLAKIYELNETKTKFDNNKFVKAAKKYSAVTKTAVAVINAVNPVYWVRKLTKETAINIIMVRIGLAIIAITGEETYKIYSKKVFNVEKTIDTGIDDIYNDITEDLENAGKQI